MKDTNLMTPDLHDFSDIRITLPSRVALLGVVLACLALLYGVFGPANVHTGDNAASPAVTVLPSA